jgi:hypothetical protein
LAEELGAGSGDDGELEMNEFYGFENFFDDIDEMVNKHMQSHFIELYNSEKSLGNIKFGQAPDDYEEYDA